MEILKQAAVMEIDFVQNSRNITRYRNEKARERVRQRNERIKEIMKIY